MRTTLGELRKLVREALHDTVAAPASSRTEPAVSDPRFSEAPPKGSMRLDSPAFQKAKVVTKAIEKQGGEADVQDVLKFIKNYEPEELVTKGTKEFVDEYLDSKQQGQTIRPGAM